MSDIEVEFLDLKAKLDNIGSLFEVDEEDESLHDLYSYDEQMSELMFDMMQLMRTMLFRIETLEKSNKFIQLHSSLEKENYPVTQTTEEGQKAIYI